MRTSRKEWALGLASLTAHRSTCLRRRVGCVFVNERGHILATGYNGVASGMPHCNQADGESYPHVCPGAYAKPGTNLDGCHVIHAEQNALLQCRNVYEIDTCYCTASPCMTCMKLLLNTSCRTIIYIQDYPHPEALELWLKAGRSIISAEMFTIIQKAI